MVAGWGGEGRTEGKVREFGRDMYTTPYLKWITIRDRLCSTGNCAQCAVPAWMGGRSGGEWIHVYGQLSPFAVHLKLPPRCLLSSYTPTQNTKFKKKNAFLKRPLHQKPLSLALCHFTRVYALDTAGTWTSRVKGNRMLRCNGKFQSFTMS